MIEPSSVANIVNVLGIPGIMGYLFYKEVGGWMRRKENGDARGANKDLKLKIDEIYARNDSGRMFEKVAHHLEKQTYVMQRMLDRMDDHKEKLQRVEDLINKRE